MSSIEETLSIIEERDEWRKLSEVLLKLVQDEGQSPLYNYAKKCAIKKYSKCVGG